MVWLDQGVEGLKRRSIACTPERTSAYVSIRQHTSAACTQAHMLQVLMQYVQDASDPLSARTCLHASGTHAQRAHILPLAFSFSLCPSPSRARKRIQVDKADMVGAAVRKGTSGKEVMCVCVCMSMRARAYEEHVTIHTQTHTHTHTHTRALSTHTHTHTHTYTPHTTHAYTHTHTHTHTHM